MILATLTLFTTLAESSSASSLEGVGEYRYGPETSEAFACEVAEKKAVEDLIIRHTGETLQHLIEKNCLNEDCKTEAQTFRTVEGKVQSIDKKEIEHYVQLGYKVCKVSLIGKVKTITSSIQLSIASSLSFKHNDLFNISIVTNTSGGDLFLFNLYNEKYVRVYQTSDLKAFKEFTFPEKGMLKALVLEGKEEANEKLLFLQLFGNHSIKDEYSINEMNAFLSSIPPTKKGIASRFVNVRR